MENKKWETITIERFISAPRERVWKAWMDPEQLVHWHTAGEGWTTPYAKVDARVGGKFDIGFQSGDGKLSFPFTGTFAELVEPEKLAYMIDDGRPVSVVFEDLGERTRIVLTLALETQNSAEQQRQGWTAMLVHLADYIGKAK
ncbi:SRPBCC domain-containing protein [Patescibacteria group bacterium]|jgi:uncharacterized protein YndB with AHSA1/START domain|nr:SRPBCC domain-containing protein [Patescibacteria group bacterium]